MKRYYIFILLAAITIFVSCAGSGKPAAELGSLSIFNPWGRPAEKGDNSAVYLVIRNSGDLNNFLIKAESPAAEMVMIHKTVMSNEVMLMSAVSNIIVPSRGQAELKPDSYHIMLMNLNKKLSPGDIINVSLTFAKIASCGCSQEIGSVNVQAKVLKQ